MKSALNTIIQIAYESGDIARHYYEKEYTIDEKKDKLDIVTTADKKIDAYIRQQVSSAFPQDEIYSEENTYTPMDFSERIWIADPIDGTLSFVWKKDQFATMIGLSENGLPSLGVMYFPMLDVLYYAEKGKGAWKKTKNKTTKVIIDNTPKKTQNITISYDERVSRMEESKPIIERMGKNIINHQKCDGKNVILDVLENTLDAYCSWFPNAGFRDLCAPTIILQEAGGILTTIDSQKINFTKIPKEATIIASSQATHGQITNLFKQILS